MSSSSAASTGPWLPVMPIAVLVAPGIGCALYPISSILRQTSRICASVAPAFINTSIERSLSAGFLPDESMQVPGPAQVERVPAGFLGLAARLPDTASSLTRVGILCSGAPAVHGNSYENTPFGYGRARLQSCRHEAC